MTDTLVAGQQLNINEHLDSNNGRVQLIMQGDGNLVLYRVDNHAPLWASGTWDKPVTHAAMQGDGNFVCYSDAGQAFWATGTWNQPGNRIVLQDDGNLVVYDGTVPKWASNTVQDWNPPTDNFLKPVHLYTDLKANHKMWTDAKLDKNTGHLTASTRYQTGTWFGGYTGGAQISLVDKDNITLYNTHAEIHGVDGTAIGRSDLTVPWSEDIPLEFVALADHLDVSHFWAVDWKKNLDKWLAVGKDISEGVGEMIKAFDGKAGSSAKPKSVA